MVWTRDSISPHRICHRALPPGTPRWGKDFKKALNHNFTRTMQIFCHGSSLPVESNSFSLDPDVKDAWGLPALRMTYQDPPNDLKLVTWMKDRDMEILDAAGAKQMASAHRLAAVRGPPLGTCRMGADAKSSVINPDHRTHDVPNLFLCDGSSLVTSGRGQPTMTKAHPRLPLWTITALAKQGICRAKSGAKFRWRYPLVSQIISVTLRSMKTSSARLWISVLSTPVLLIDR